MQILDVHNPEIKKKLMKIGKKQIQGKRVLPGPDIIYTKETVIDCDPSYLKGKRERYSGYENSNYSYSKRNGYCDYNNNIAFDHHEEDIQTFNYECESYSKKSKKCKVEKFDTLINASNSTKMSISYFKPKDSSNEINDSSIVKNKRNSFETNKTETTNYTSTNYSEKPKILQDTNFSQLQTSKMKKLENNYNNTDCNKKINNDEYSERSESNKNCISKIIFVNNNKEEESTTNLNNKENLNKLYDEVSNRNKNKNFSEKELKTQFYDNNQPRYSLKTENLNISSKTSKNDLNINVKNSIPDFKEYEESLSLIKSISYPDYSSRLNESLMNIYKVNHQLKANVRDNDVKKLFRKRDKSRFLFADNGETISSLTTSSIIKSEQHKDSKQNDDLPEVLDEILCKKTSRFLFFKKFYSIKSDLDLFDKEINSLDSSWIQFIIKSDKKLII